MHTTFSFDRARSTARCLPGYLGLVTTCLLACAPNTNALRSQIQDSPASLETSVHQVVNAQRRHESLLPLRRSRPLDTEARNHSLRMAQGRTRFGHNGAKKRAALLIEDLDLQSVAENVARNQGYADPVAVAMKGWRASKGHRKNLLGAYDLTGIGVAKSNDGTVYFTQIFGRSRP